MNLDTATARAQRVLDRCPRPPYELDADDPIRLLHEFVSGGGIRDLHAELASAQSYANECEGDATAAEERAEKAEDRLNDMRDAIAAACDRAMDAREEDGDKACLDELLVTLGKIERGDA